MKFQPTEAQQAILDRIRPDIAPLNNVGTFPMFDHDIGKFIVGYDDQPWDVFDDDTDFENFVKAAYRGPQ